LTAATALVIGTMQIYIDGEFHSRERPRFRLRPRVALRRRCLEGIRVHNRRIFRHDAHLDRLYMSAQALALKIPLTLPDMRSAVEETVRRNQRDDVYIRLIVTRGVGELGIDPLSCPQPSVIVIVNDVRVYPRELYAGGITVMTSATRQVSHEAVDPRIKSLNYLKNILAKIDAQQAGAHEAIMLNPEGFIAECTADNLFLVSKGQLLTPSPQDGALGGITRGVILELAAEARIPAAEARLTRYDLYTADEAFVSGTGAELMPVSIADGRAIGGGTPGPITRRLTEVFHALVRNEGNPLW
jgi:branched-chain amino acid aminotransferase